MTRIGLDYKPAVEGGVDRFVMDEGKKRLAIRWVGTIGVLLVASGLKAVLILADRVPFNADEAIVALMARHILQGDRPIFFYGQAYMGSLDAYLVAAGFLFFGQHVWVIRLIQVVLYLGTLVSTAYLGKMVFGTWEVGVLAGCFLAIPTVNLTVYTTASLGGYGEMLLIGNLILILALRIASNIERGAEFNESWTWAGLGFLVGLGVWTFGLTLVYSLPVLSYLAWRGWKTHLSSNLQNRWKEHVQWIGAITFGGLIGSAPWWWFALGSGFRALLNELGGGAIAGVEGLTWPIQIIQHVLNFILFGSTVITGLRPPWAMQGLAWPLLPVAVAFWIAVFLYANRRLAFWGKPSLLAGVGITLVIGFIMTPFGADPSGRYFLPLGVVLASFAARAVLDWRCRLGGWVWVLVAIILVFNLLGTLQTARKVPPGMSTQIDATTQIDHRYDQALVAFLRAHGERRGYSNYWVSYPIAFLSREELIFVPLLPYHLDFRFTPRDNRYEPYNQLVDRSDRVAYITTRHPYLDERLRKSFKGLGITWNEAEIGDYRIFFDLSRPVRPDEVGL